MDVVPEAIYAYDEADYMYAVKEGFWNNYLDKSAISIDQFIQKGITLGLSSEGRSELSQFIRTSNDISFYRHYHGPIYYYYLIAAQNIGIKSEKMYRLFSFFFLFLSAVLVFFSVYRLMPDGKGTIAGFVSMSAVIFSPTLIITTGQITPHALYLLIVVCNLTLQARMMQNKSIKYWYYSIVALSVAFLTFEYAPLLLISLAASGFAVRSQLFSNRSVIKTIGKSIALFLGLIILIWPGGLIKLTLLKNYVFFAYFAIIRGGTYSKFPFYIVWLTRIKESFIEFVLIVCSIGFLYRRRKQYYWLLPFALYGGLVFLVTIRNTSFFATYISSLMLCLLVAAGIFVEHSANAIRKKVLRLAYLAGIFIIITINSVLFFLHFANNSKQHPTVEFSSAAVSYFTSQRMHTIASPSGYIPQLHYYHNDRHLESYVIDPNCGITTVIDSMVDRFPEFGILIETDTEITDSLYRYDGYNTDMDYITSVKNSSLFFISFRANKETTL